MALYISLEPLSYQKDADTVVHITEAGRIIELTTDQAALLPGKIAYWGSGSNYLAPQITMLAYDNDSLFPDEGTKFHVYLAQDTGRLYQWSEDADGYELVTLGETSSNAIADATATGKALLTAADQAAARDAIDAADATTVTNALADKQPLDEDLTAIAGTATTTFGRGLLTTADDADARDALGAVGRGAIVVDVRDAPYSAADDAVTDDAAAISSAITDVVAQGGGTVLLGHNHRVGDNPLIPTVVVPELITVNGHGGHSNGRGTVITSNATSGPVVQLSGRSARLNCVRVTATAARRAAVTTTGHGVFIGGDDVASGYPSMSRVSMFDVDIRDQPTDGVHSIGAMEFSRLGMVTAADCVRHGFVLGGGMIAGWVNQQQVPFMLTLEMCRALECGGQALICLSESGSAPQGVYLENFEALGCAWDSSKRNTVGVGAGAELFQVQLGGRGHTLHRPDVEDQQYANATTTTGGHARTALATPAKGIYCRASGVSAHRPYFSSLVQSWFQETTTEGLEIRQPFIVAGAYGVSQAPAIQVPATCSGVEILYSTSMTSGASTVVQNQSKNARIVANGLPLVGLGTTILPGWGDGLDPVGSTISAAVLTVANRRTQVNGEGAAADNFQNMRLAPGVNGYKGMDIWLFRGAEDITVNHGTGNIRNLSGKNIVMTATANTVLRYAFDGTNWVQVGLSLPVAAGAYTQTYSTADKTLGAYTADVENVAYTGSPADAAATAKLDDLNALRVAYENLRGFTEDLAQQHNSLIADLKTLGLIQ